MNIDATKTVGELTASLPNAYRVFEKAGIDYCCGGSRTLADACARAGVAVEPLLRSLADAAASGDTTAIDWRARPLGELIGHVLQTHHVFTRDELDRADRLLTKVRKVHGDHHPELHDLRALFDALSGELLTHLQKEENVLFPYILALEEAQRAGRPAATPPFRTVARPVWMMNLEHESAGEMLRAIRKATSDYTPPPDACGSFRALYASLAALEEDLHLHIHLESNVLFPRAIELEQKG